MSDTNKLHETIYRETLDDLRAKIESKSGSVLKFCQENEIDYFNLIKLFNKTQGKEMSIGLFCRVMTGLGFPGLSGVLSTSTLSLKSYLEIDNNAILKSILFIKFT